MFKQFFSIFLLAAVLVTMAACGTGDGLRTGISFPTEPQKAGILVNQIENIPEDFLMGADVSSLLSLENSGVIFYDFQGQPADLLEVLRDSGVNCIRVRVWNDPFDEAGRGYGGGNCDLNTALELGRRAKALGMSLLVDFHYSDFWADPGKQQAPKAWQDMDLDTKAQAVYDYTRDSLKTLKRAGIPVHMVQIGNETTTSFCGEDSVPRMMVLMEAASRAVRDTLPDTLIAVHYTNPESGKYSQYAGLLKANGVDYDVFASSWYPYWHGTLENLTSQLRTIGEKYGKRVMVAETSWAYTTADGDGHGNTIGENLTYEKPWPFTVQGQASELSAVIGAMAELGEMALGVFYWEPAWIPVPGGTWEQRQTLWETCGSGWASSYAGEYDPEDAGRYYGGSACDNQALFSFDGHPLESLKTFLYVRCGTLCPVQVDSLEPAYVSVRRNNPITLPQTVEAVYNDGTLRPVAVTWDADATMLAELSGREVGTYPVYGTTDGNSVVCWVSVQEENYAGNYSFEEADTSMWVITHLAEGPQTDFQVKATDAYTGDTSLHFWNETAVGFRVQQTATGLRPGTYKFSIQAQGGDMGEGARLLIWAEADGVRYEQTFTVQGWAVWQNPTITGIVCREGEITFGATVEAPGGAWGTLDDFLLNPVED